MLEKEEVKVKSPEPFLTHQELQILLDLRKFIDSKNLIGQQYENVIVPGHLYKKLFDEFLRCRQIISRNLT